MIKIAGKTCRGLKKMMRLEFLEKNLIFKFQVLTEVALRQLENCEDPRSRSLENKGFVC